MTSTLSKTKQACLRVIPLGGLHEIGKNTCVFEYGDDLMLVDAGLAFPSDGMHGVNVVMPDTSFLRENQSRIRGMIVTHGHEDHIGGIAHHLKNFDIPVIYGPRLALSMLTGKMDEAGVTDRTTLQTVGPKRCGEGGSALLGGVHSQHPLDGRQLFAGDHDSGGHCDFHR